LGSEDIPDAEVEGVGASAPTESPNRQDQTINPAVKPIRITTILLGASNRRLATGTEAPNYQDPTNPQTGRAESVEGIYVMKTPGPI
jgi:hypothetical protein